LKITILGCYGPYPPAGGACSGYLVSEDGWNILLDCGNGILSRLQEYLAFQELNAIILSHLHADHVSDIMIMRYGLELAYNRALRNEPLPLYAPAEPAGEFERLSYKNAYKVSGVSEETELQIGPFTIKFRSGIHAVPALSMRIESPSGVMVYSGDTEFNSGLAEFSKRANLLLCEANYLEADIDAGLPNHLSAAQAAQVASEAGVNRLVLTHFYPERDPVLSLAEAVIYFPFTELAKERQEIII